MGTELAPWEEWHHDAELPWHLLDDPQRRAFERWLTALNVAYRHEPALHALDCDPHGFEWIDTNDADRSVISFLRKSPDGREQIAVVCNFTPVPRYNYRVGAPRGGYLARASQQRRQRARRQRATATSAASKRRRFPATGECIR